VVDAVFPAEVRAALARLLGRLTQAFSPSCYINVTDMDGMSTNEIHDAVQLYLSSTTAPALGAASASRTRSMPPPSPSGSLLSTASLMTSRGAAVMLEHVVTPRMGKASCGGRSPRRRAASHFVEVAKVGFCLF
jgi:chaperone BCS1